MGVIWESPRDRFLLKVIEENKKRDDSYFVIVGSGTEYMRVKLWFDTHLPQNACLLAALPKAKYDELVSLCDVGLIFLDKRFTIPNFPSRLLSYLECSMPVLMATDVNTDIGRIAEEGGFGLWTENGNIDTFMEMIEFMVEDDKRMKEMGERGYRFLCENYTVDKSYKAIMKHFESMYKYGLKRVIDFILVFIVLVVIWPILLLITIWLHFANKGAGAFFTQERPGKDGRIFRVIKFKSMTDERDVEGKLLPDAKRLTHVGKFVRATSLDELPQLINVLKGDMALIGPRPLLPEYLPLYSKEQARRHEVRPGITGWAQVNGRNAISWMKKFELDVWYVDHCSFLLDLKIIFLTMRKVLLRKDISSNTSVTMEAFTGNN